MTLAPIILFVYNRPWHTEQTLEALMQNELANESTLYIYSDGPKEDASAADLDSIRAVRNVLRKKKWCKDVVIKSHINNLGLADNIINGVTEIVNRHGKVIVLEDDIVTSSSFLKYMNDALIFYENEEKVMHISGYFPNVKRKLPQFFFYNQTSCWGWATWKRAWSHFTNETSYLLREVKESNRLFEFNTDGSYPFLSHLEDNLRGNIKTWAIKWHSSVFLQKGLCLHPSISYVQNIGLDNSGEHCDSSNRYFIEYLNSSEFIPPKKLIENYRSRKAMVVFNRGSNDSLIQWVIKKVKRRKL